MTNLCSAKTATASAGAVAWAVLGFHGKVVRLASTKAQAEAEAKKDHERKIAPLYLAPCAPETSPVDEQLRQWIWEQTEKHDGDLTALQPAFDLILNKIDELRETARAPEASLNVEPFDDKWLGDGDNVHVMPEASPDRARFPKPKDRVEVWAKYPGGKQWQPGTVQDNGHVLLDRGVMFGVPRCDGWRYIAPEASPVVMDEMVEALRNEVKKHYRDGESISRENSFIAEGLRTAIQIIEAALRQPAGEKP